MSSYLFVLYEGEFDFFKIDGNGRGSEILCQKRGRGKGKMGGGGRGLSRNGELSYYIEAFLESPHDTAQEKKS